MMKVAIVSMFSTTSLTREHLYYPLFGLQTVLYSLYSRFGDRLTYKSIISNEAELPKLISSYCPDVVFISVGNYRLYEPLIKVAESIRDNDIPVIMGGVIFTCDRNMARISVEKRKIPVCYGDGRETAVQFLNHCLDPYKYPLSSVPFIFYVSEDGKVNQTPEIPVSIGSFSFPVLPKEVFDPVEVWRRNSRKIRTSVGPQIVLGCRYKHIQKKKGLEGCNYCSCTYYPYESGSGDQFWIMLNDMYNWLQSFDWPSREVACFHGGDDMFSDPKMVNSIWEARLRHTIPSIMNYVYAWFVSETVAKKLSQTGKWRVYLGADGKSKHNYIWSEQNPIVISLKNCRKYSLTASLSFVLGQRGQSWSDIDRWDEFRTRALREFGDDVLLATYGYTQAIRPGSPDWSMLCSKYPQFLQTDLPDYEMAFDFFNKDFTFLCEMGKYEKVGKRIFDRAEEFTVINSSEGFL